MTQKNWINDVVDAAQREVASWPEWMQRPEVRVPRHQRRLTKLTPKPGQCGVPSLTLGHCDLKPRHKDMHSSGGDGFAGRCGRCREPLKHDDVYIDHKPTDVLQTYICGQCSGILTLAERLAKASAEIFKKTKRGKANFLRVTAGSPLHQAIERGEFSAFGIEPGTGFKFLSVDDDGSFYITTEPKP